MSDELACAYTIHVTFNSLTLAEIIIQIERDSILAAINMTYRGKDIRINDTDYTHNNEYYEKYILREIEYSKSQVKNNVNIMQFIVRSIVEYNKLLDDKVDISDKKNDIHTRERNSS